MQRRIGGRGEVWTFFLPVHNRRCGHPAAGLLRCRGSSDYADDCERDKTGNAFNIGIGQVGGLADWFAIGMSFAIIIAVVIYALGRVSGARINPGVTIALWATKRFPAQEAAGYIIAQCIGAGIGSLLVFLRSGWTGSRSAGWQRHHSPDRLRSGDSCRGDCDLCPDARYHGSGR